MKREFKLPNT